MNRNRGHHKRRPRGHIEHRRDDCQSGAGEGAQRIGLGAAERARDFVADDVAQHATEHRGDHAHEHRNDSGHFYVQCELSTGRGKQAQTQYVGPLVGQTPLH
jgi:hypothetical protein